MATVVEIDTNSKDADHVLWFLEGNAYSQTIKAACELELFDELSAGPKTAAQIADPKDWSTPALDKLLSMCAAMKLVQKTKTGENFAYSLLGPGRLMVKNGPPALYETGLWGGGGGHLAKLADQVKKVKSGNDDAWDEENYEPDVESHRMMEGMAMCYMDALVGAIDCTKYKTAVDLGAGTGVVGVVVCRRNPQMSVTLVDKAAVLKLAKDHFIPADLSKRITYLAGDFFETALPQADLFLGSMIVKHMNEETIKKLLGVIKKKLNPGGTVAFIDSLLTENKDGPLIPLVWSMVEGLTPTTDTRPGSFYMRILKEEGFTEVKVIQSQDRCNYNVICGKKP